MFGSNIGDAVEGLTRFAFMLTGMMLAVAACFVVTFWHPFSWWMLAAVGAGAWIGNFCGGLLFRR